MIQPRLMKYATAQFDAATAEDIVSESLLVLYRKQPPLPRTEGEERALRALAFEILYGLIRNEHRAKRRRMALVERLIAHRELPGAAPSHEMAISERSHAAQVLGRLSPDDRDVLLLFNAGFDASEMAQILGCSTEAAAKRRHRARARLREILADAEGVDHDRP